MTIEEFGQQLTGKERTAYLKKIIKKDELIDVARQENGYNKMYALLSGAVAASTATMTYILYKDQEIGLAIMSGLNTLASFGLSGYLANKIIPKTREIAQLQQGKKRLENLL